jgi:hypothetical protein
MKCDFKKTPGTKPCMINIDEAYPGEGVEPYEAYLHEVAIHNALLHQQGQVCPNTTINAHE